MQNLKEFFVFFNPKLPNSSNFSDELNVFLITYPYLNRQILIKIDRKKITYYEICAHI